MTLTPVNGGWIEIICGPMFSGKTEELIRRLVRAQIAKQRVAIFKPSTDNRYEEDFIVSHNQRKIQSIQVKKTQSILDHKDDADVFGIDEAQFFDDSIVSVCKDLANCGRRVVIAGLEKDYLGKSFGPMPQLLVDAEYITKVNAICMSCGDPANYSHRISREKKQVVVGETDKYEALCRSCYVQSKEDV
ncbi:MAG: thymidine kinase [Candidatus Marinimicrobia bacterium]|jgi:thymidine kinase|nr:thymidine kinase [Candidatus Neomarinimicrobiota bacterium]MDP6936219.1 thymidine kinase [Candidatus Neomarinimicrobiota bacterium]